MLIDRERIVQILLDWQQGIVRESQVQEFAESFTDHVDFPESGHDEDESIAPEVLLCLDALPALLITKDDIPAMIDFLSTPRGQAQHGWDRWQSYWASVDDNERRRQLESNPFYFI
jgi:hypothetical protein